MPAPPIPQDVQAIMNVYRRAQEKLVAIIAEKSTKGSAIHFQSALLSQIRKELEQLDREALNWANEVIPKNYQKGIDSVHADLNKMGIKFEDTFQRLNKEAAELAAANSYAKLNDANVFIGRRINDVIRQVGIEAIQEKLTVGFTVKQTKEVIVQRLIDEGFKAFKDKRGRMISLDAYAETVARSTTREATNKATFNQAVNLGYDLVQMSSHFGSCPVCAPLQGRVYSISGTSTEYPPLSQALPDGFSIVHPNCRHTFSPYIPALADEPVKDKAFSNRSFEKDPRSEHERKSYENALKLRRKDRNNRNQFQRYKMALEDEAPGTLSAFMRMKNANSPKWQELQSKYKSYRNIHNREEL
jgi:hypothetical protein